MAREDDERMSEYLTVGLMANSNMTMRPSEACQPMSSEPQDGNMSQWQLGPNLMFRPTSRTVKMLPSAAFVVEMDNRGVYLRMQIIKTDEVVILPDSSNTRALVGIQRFWESRENYNKHGLVFKRGILLFGPPGSGKTISITLLVQDIIKRKGIVVYGDNPTQLVLALRGLRSIEPKRPLVVVLEDIDEIIGKYGEHEVLALLDGEYQTDNIVCVASTNYPERLGARIVNRPSRFDDRIFVGMPSLVARRAYLEKTLGAEHADIERWAGDTDGLSIAHIRELVVSVHCLQYSYQETLSRLRSMNERPKEVDGYARRNLGFEIAGQGGR